MKLANHRRIASLSPKIRAKVGPIVSRSSSVSLTSKTIRGRSAMVLDSLLSGPLSPPAPSLPALEPAAMRGLLGAVAADRHDAPPSRAPAGVIGKQHRAAMAFARLHVCKVLVADKFCQRFADRQQQGFGRSPAPHPLQRKTITALAVTWRDLPERFVAFQEGVQRAELVQRLRRERPAGMLANEASKPLA